MNNEKNHCVTGWARVRPYIYGNLDLLDLVREVFGAEEVERLPMREASTSKPGSATR